MVSLQTNLWRFSGLIEFDRPCMRKLLCPIEMLPKIDRELFRRLQDRNAGLSCRFTGIVEYSSATLSQKRQRYVFLRFFNHSSCTTDMSLILSLEFSKARLHLSWCVLLAILRLTIQRGDQRIAVCSTTTKAQTPKKVA